MKSGRNVLSLPGVPSLLEEICHGRLAWDLVHPFPEQQPADAAIGDKAVHEIDTLLAERVPADTDTQFSKDLVDALRSAGYLHLVCGEDIGGRGLSAFNAFRVMTAVSSRSMAAGLLLGIHNGIGAPAYLPVLPNGRLRDFVRERLAHGALTGMADTEPSGAANRARTTTATPIDGGTGYSLTGDKLYIGNGPIAELIAVTATLHEDGVARTRIFFVDTDSEGFEVAARLEFMGFRGFPNGALRLRDVRVPGERLLVESADGWLPPERAAVLSRGRVYVVAAPSLALARGCLEWSREYILRRTVNGIRLADYDEIQRTVAASLADTFALDTVTRWTMLGDGSDTPVNLMQEQVAAKDISSLLCWRIAERTMTLMAGEGFETARGKAARGATPSPVERLFRDARGTRIAGGTEILLQTRLASNVVFSYFYPEPDNAAAIESGIQATGNDAPPDLSTRNQEHWRTLWAEVVDFARTCLATARANPDHTALGTNGRMLVLIGQLAEELITTTLVLSRTATLASTGTDVQDLADLYCTAAWQRVADWRRQLSDATLGHGPDHASVSADWLFGERLGFLGGGA